METILSVLAAVNPIIPPVAGAIVGALIMGVLVQRHWVKRSSELGLIDKLITDVNELEQHALDYWSLDYSGTTEKDHETSRQARALAIKIRAGSMKLTSALRVYSERYCRYMDFVTLMGQLHDACTNGEFDAAHRGPDHDRYKLIVNASNRIRSTLFKRRV